jgi:hypothetical protein
VETFDEDIRKYLRSIRRKTIKHHLNIFAKLINMEQQLKMIPIRYDHLMKYKNNSLSQLITMILR